MKYAIDQFLIDVTSELQLNLDFNPQREVIGEIDLQSLNNPLGLNSTEGTEDTDNAILPDFILNGQNIVRPELPSYNPNTGLVTMLGGPKQVSGSIQINKPGTRIKLESFGGTNQGDF